MELNKEQLESLKQEVDLVLYENQQIQISSQEEYVKAGDILKLLKNKSRDIEEKRKEHTDPLEKLKKQWIAEFKILTDPINKLIDNIECSMKTFYLEDKRKRDIEQEKIDAEALKKAKENNISEIDVPIVNDVKTQRGNVSTTTAISYKDFEIIDESLIPREYLIINESKIRNDINLKGFSQIKEILGVRIFDDVRINSRGR